MSWTKELIDARNALVFPTAALPEDRRKRVASVKLEAQIQNECVGIMIADGWRYLKTDPVSDRSRGKGFGEPGMADGLFLRYSPNVPLGTNPRQRAEVIWIEFKRRTSSGEDTKAAEHQKKWHIQERAKGALVVVAGEDFPATTEGFEAWYRASGLYRGGAR